MLFEGFSLRVRLARHSQLPLKGLLEFELLAAEGWLLVACGSRNLEGCHGRS